jgi:hypothetical protein
MRGNVMKRFLAMLLAAVMCLTALVGCGGGTEQSDSPTVMTVDGEEIPASELAAYTVYNLAYYENYFGMDASFFTDDSMFTSLKESCANQVVTLRAIEKMADDLGVTLSSDDKKELEETKKSNMEYVGAESGSFKRWIAYTIKGEEDPWETYLNSMGYTSELFDQDSEIMALESNLVDYYFEQGDITEEFNNTYLHAKSILISDTDEDGNVLEGDDFDAAKKQAVSVQRKLNDGEDFDTLYEQYNEDTAENDDGYYFTEGDMVADYYDAVNDLEIGEHAKNTVYYEGYGWFIIERLDLDEDALEDTESYVSNQGDGDDSTIKTAIGDALVEEKLQDYIDGMEVEYTDEYDKITVYNVNTYLGFVRDPLVSTEGSGSVADGSAGGSAE